MKDLAEILRNNKVGKGYIDFEIDEAKIIEFIKGNRYGVAIKEIHAFVGNIISRTSLYSFLSKIPEIMKIRIVSESENMKNGLLGLLPYEVRWFLRGNMHLKKDEDIYDCLWY